VRILSTLVFFFLLLLVIITRNTTMQQNKSALCGTELIKLLICKKNEWWGWWGWGWSWLLQLMLMLADTLKSVNSSFPFQLYLIILVVVTWTNQVSSDGKSIEKVSKIRSKDVQKNNLNNWKLNFLNTAVVHGIEIIIRIFGEIQAEFITKNILKFDKSQILSTINQPGW
jgi:hypothetical protein